MKNDKSAQAGHWLRRGERGQSMVEFALCLPVLLLLLCGVIEFGWVMGNQLILANVTREGVRAGIVATTAADNSAVVIERIENMAPENLRDGLEITVTYSDATDFRAGDVTVVTHYNLKSITPLAGLITPDGCFDLSSECTMKMS